MQSERDKMFEDKKIQFTAVVMGANIMWLQNMSSLVSQLCSTVAVVTRLQFLCVRRFM
jgi:hypothetical protein